jgi:hypothetical protein
MPRTPDPYLRAVPRGTMSAEPPCPPALLISDSVWYEVCFGRPRQLADLVASDIPCARQSVGYALDQTVKRSSVAALVARPTCFLCAQQAILSGRNLVDGSARLVKSGRVRGRDQLVRLDTRSKLRRRTPELKKETSWWYGTGLERIRTLSTS